jgi:hypothetical protein
MNRSILLPMCAMVFLTMIVWLWMYYTRLKAIFRSGQDPQVLADEAKAMKILGPVVNPSDNLENLFEMPVLFYAAVLTIVASGSSDRLFVGAAWAYVALRAAHSLIHCTSNRIMHRFTAYALSSLVLWAIWIRIALHLCCPLGSTRI